MPPPKENCASRTTIDQRLDRLEALILDYTQTAQARVDAIDDRVAALEEQGKRAEQEQAAIKSDLDRALRILDRLVADDKAVLRRTPGRCVLDKQRVYEAAQSDGFSRLDLLRTLDAAGRLLKEKDGAQQRYTCNTRVGGELVRAVIIINK